MELTIDVGRRPHRRRSEPRRRQPRTRRPPPPVAFDVLVTGADTAAPRVVAWGGPGTGPTLVPFGNAVAAGTHTRPHRSSTAAVTWRPPPTASHGPAG